MNSSNRIFFSDNGTISELTDELSDYILGSKVLPIVAAEDALYLASDLPFNARFFDVKVANANTAAISEIAAWGGQAWHPLVDIGDRTSLSSKTLAQTGLITFNPDLTTPWLKAQQSEDVTGLESTKIFNMYWLRIKFSADLSALTELNYVGFKFCDQNAVFAQYPGLSRTALMTAFKSGKADWNEQIYVASDEMINDLKAAGLISSASQLLDWKAFELACIHKTAEVIYRALGDSYENDTAKAREKYYQTRKLGVYRIDRNQNAKVDEEETGQQTGFMTR